MSLLPKAFNEDTQELIEYLLHNFWITKEKNQEVYFAIYERYDMLRQFFYEKFKYELVMQPEVMKLEKVPITPKPWMGIEEFTKKVDYVFFSLVMAFLEKLLLEQFVLSDITKYINTHNPTGEMIGWTLGKGYHNRLSLIRTLKYIENMGMIESVEYEIEDYKSSEDYEVLYNKMPLHRYYMRNRTQNFAEANSIIDVYILTKEEAQAQGITIKEKLYRELLLLPCLHESNLLDKEIEFMRNHYELIETEMENYIGCFLELYKSSAFLLRENSHTEAHVFPNRRKESLVITQLASLLRDYITKQAIRPDTKGKIFVAKIQLEEWIEELRELHSHEWPVAYLSQSAPDLVDEIVEHLTDWNFIEFNGNRNEYVFFDVIGRICGYSVDDTPNSRKGGEFS